MSARILRLRWLAVACCLSLAPFARADSSAASASAPASASTSADLGARIHVDDAAVERAMRDELARATSELRLGDEPKPYYVAYTISDIDQATVSATFGALTSDVGFQARVLRTDVRVGDPSFDNSNFEGSGGHIESLPIDDDYAALRRELWLRTDEGYKGAVETLARKRSTESGQAKGDSDDAVGDFSSEAPTKLALPRASRDTAEQAAALRERVVKLSAILRDYPAIQGSRVNGSYAVGRRRMLSSEGTWIDDSRRIVRIDVTADTQADDGMKLRTFVPFTALTPGSLPAAADMEKAVRGMAAELTAMRKAPVAHNGSAAVLFEGAAAGQIVKHLLAEQLTGTPPPKTASAGSDEQGQSSELANKLGLKVASVLLSVADDPLQETGPARAPLIGAYRADDEGIPAQRVSVIEKGILKALLMSRTPSQEIAHSNGHARAPRFAPPHVHIGNLIVTPTAPGLARKALLARMEKTAKAGGLEAYVVRLLDDPNVPGGDADDMMSLFSFSLGGGRGGPPPVKPLVVYRVKDGQEQLVRGLTLEGLLPRSLKEITAVGRDPIVYSFIDSGGGGTGIPSSIVTPSLLFSDVDIRRTTGKNRKPPLYPRPATTAGASSDSRAPE
jgi:predicted Zn-dependent protease